MSVNAWQFIDEDVEDINGHQTDLQQKEDWPIIPVNPSERHSHRLRNLRLRSAENFNFNGWMIAEHTRVHIRIAFSRRICT